MIPIYRQSNVWSARAEHAIRALLSGTAAAAMFTMMALTLVDVLGRYLFSSPVSGAYEVTELLLAAVIFMGLPLITADDGHIAVDILDGVFSDRVHAVQTWLIRLINIAAFGIFAWLLWENAFKVLRYEDTTAVLKIPYAWLGFMMAVTTSFTTLVLVAQFIIKLANKTPEGER
jgi:TRAP-type C4-dicarboxylate transport system permease small subunit